MTPDNDSRLHKTLRLLIAVWAVLLVLAMVPFTEDPVSPIKHLITAWAALLVAAVWLCTGFSRRASFRMGPALGLPFAFLIVNLLAAWCSEYPAHSVFALRSWTAFALLALVASHVYTRPDHVWRLAAFAVVAVSIASVYGFCQRAGFDPFPWQQRETAEYLLLPATFGNPNFAGHTLLMALILAVALATRRGTRWCLVPALLIGGHLYMTQMRGAQVALAAAVGLLLVFAVLLRLNRRRPGRAVVLTCICTLGLGAAAAGLMATKLNFEEDSPLAIDGSLVLRLNGYHGASRMMLERPLLGFGPGNYERENIPYWTGFEQRWFAAKGKKNAHVHCEPLEAGVEAGIPGAMLFIGMLVWAVMRALTMGATGRSPDERRMGLALAGCFTAFAVDGVFGFNFHVPVSAGLFLLLLGVLDGLTSPPAPRSLPGRTHGLSVSAFAAVKQRGAALTGYAVVIVLAALCVTAETRSFRAELYYQQAQGAQVWARSFAEAGEAARARTTLDTAYQLLRRGRPLLPWDMRFPEAMGRIDLHEGRLEEAVRNFEVARASDPHNPRLLISLARTNLNRAAKIKNAADAWNPAPRPEFEAALSEVESYARKAIEVCPPLPDAYDALGRAEFLRASATQPAGVGGAGRQARYEQAAQLFEQALRLGARDKAALERILAQTYFNLHEFGPAAAALQRAAKADPGNHETWRLYRIIDDDADLVPEISPGFTRGLLDALNANLNRVMKRKPAPLEAAGTLAVHLAEVYAKSDYDPVLVRRRLRQVLALGPAKLDLWGAVAATFSLEERRTGLLAEIERLEAPEAGEDASRRVVRTVLGGMDSSGPEDRREAAETLAEAARALAANDATDAIAQSVGWLADLFLRKLEETPRPSDGPVLAYLGEAYLAAKWWAKADTALARAVPLLPRDAGQATARMLHSRALARLGRTAEALAEAREARRRAPMSFPQGWNLARRLVDARRLEEARLTYASLLDDRTTPIEARKEVRRELDALLQVIAQEAGGAR